MSKKFFTSDSHFGHKNVIKFCNRPFADVDEMDEAMIQRWNEKVSPEDEVYHLGDVGLCAHGRLREILERLNGKIYLIKGNHESAALACHERFEWIKGYHELRIEDEDFHQNRQYLMLFHYSMREWNGSHRGTFHLYGHSHGTLPDLPNQRCFDIGVDCTDFYPLSYEEVKAKMMAKNWTPPFAKRN